MKHTKEPWGIGDKGKTVLKTYSPTKAKILVEGVNFFNEDLNKANIERIVACVNACAGITTEALEAGIVMEGLMEMERSFLNMPKVCSDTESLLSLETHKGHKIWENEA